MVTIERIVHDAAETVATCTATTKDGSPCRGRPMPGKTLCFAHAPEQAATLAEARRAGGRASSAESRAHRKLRGGLSLALAEDRLVEAMSGLIAGTVEPGVAAALASVARALALVRAEARAESVEQHRTDSTRITPVPPIDYRSAEIALRDLIAKGTGVERPPEA